VLVSTSTAYQNDGRLVTTAFEALRHRDDLLIVATVPRAILVTTIRRPTAVLIGSWLTASSSARPLQLVCHAGMGITQ